MNDTVQITSETEYSKKLLISVFISNMDDIVECDFADIKN